ncbi:hypothetical protein [Cohnella rhizosphaerae]|uniref:Uncharacterized protein n=1 Tax=Cohnella rhizosphaerae TaxID=1457232 RepID=A0A9X4QRZ5_9BACL|nr:hypothetical protein [Cohnella rhizosphaerae]MDG0808798.1 hypothetical protein [Cohnella rhizosphaerae]
MATRWLLSRSTSSSACCTMLLHVSPEFGLVGEVDRQIVPEILANADDVAPPLALYGQLLQQLAVNDPDHLGEALGLSGPCIRPFLL